MAKYINADIAIDFYKRASDIYFCTVSDYIKFLESVSDAIEVVRCKDCKYYNLKHHYCEGIGNWFGMEDEWSDNGFCYKGERKDNAEVH